MGLALERILHLYPNKKHPKKLDAKQKSIFNKFSLTGNIKFNLIGIAYPNVSKTVLDLTKSDTELRLQFTTLQGNAFESLSFLL